MARLDLGYLPNKILRPMGKPIAAPEWIENGPRRIHISGTAGHAITASRRWPFTTIQSELEALAA